MELLWHLAPEPVVCFDGDRAGEAAAARAIDRMLPNLREGRSFCFAFLPEGSDPDDLVRTKGAGAFAACLASARPLIDVLWLRELKTHAIETPERRAAFEARLENLLADIANTRVRDHYRREVKGRLFNLWREKATRRGKPQADAGSRPTAKSGLPPMPSSYGFATVIILALVNHPWLLAHFAEEVAHLEIRDKKLASLLQAVTRAILDDHNVTREHLAELLAASTQGKLFDRLQRESAFKRVTFVQPDSPGPDVQRQFADLIYRFRALPNLTRELEEHADHLADLTEAEFEHFSALQQQVAQTLSTDVPEDAGDRVFHDRFAEKVAQVTREKASWKQGRRVEKPG
jgi:DNA primase